MYTIMYIHLFHQNLAQLLTVILFPSWSTDSCGTTDSNRNREQKTVFAGPLYLRHQILWRFISTTVPYIDDIIHSKLWNIVHYHKYESTTDGTPNPPLCVSFVCLTTETTILFASSISSLLYPTLMDIQTPSNPRSQ